MIVVVGESLVDIVVARDGEPQRAPSAARRSTSRSGSPGSTSGRPWSPASATTSAAAGRPSTSTASDVDGGRRIGRARRPHVSAATARLDERRRRDLRLRPRVGPAARRTCPPTPRRCTSARSARPLDPGRAQRASTSYEQAATRDLFVSYDPNLRPAFIADAAPARADVLEIAAQCPLVKLSATRTRASCDPGGDPEDVARELLDGDAHRAGRAHPRRRRARSPSPSATTRSSAQPRPVEVVDTVGAGDSFMAATLALLDDWERPATRVRRAAAGPRRRSGEAAA